MKIIVDAMGGDNAPHAVVQGALDALSAYGKGIILVGRSERILSVLQDMGVGNLPAGLEIADAPEIVEMEDNPASTLRDKPASSMAVGLKLLSEQQGGAFVSAGNTGALLAASLLKVKRIKGIRRAALAPIVPTGHGGALLIDCGANLECKPEYLLQFACMGSIYARGLLKNDSPRVGLLNIGAEETKGLELQKSSYPLLQKASEAGIIRFVGNIEGRDAVMGAADVIVSDGWTGNMFLKTMEGVGMFFAGMLKEMFTRSAKTKLAALLCKDGIATFKKTLDYSETGGSPLLGLAAPVIKAHGSSNEKAICNAIRQAITFAESGVIDDIRRQITTAGDEN